MATRSGPNVLRPVLRSSVDDCPSPKQFSHGARVSLDGSIRHRAGTRLAPRPPTHRRCRAIRGAGRHHGYPPPAFQGFNTSDNTCAPLPAPGATLGYHDCRYARNSGVNYGGVPVGGHKQRCSGHQGVSASGLIADSGNSHCPHRRRQQCVAVRAAHCRRLGLVDGMPPRPRYFSPLG
jgi:hypothetical protein